MRPSKFPPYATHIFHLTQRKSSTLFNANLPPYSTQIFHLMQRKSSTLCNANLPPYATQVMNRTGRNSAFTIDRPTKLHMPGVEPGSQAWGACMMPLHYMCSCRLTCPSYPTSPATYDSVYGIASQRPTGAETIALRLAP